MRTIGNIESKTLTYRGETYTGREFGNLVIACVDDGKQFIRILFDQDGNPVIMSRQAVALADFFELTFTPATLDGAPCLVNIEDL